MNLVGIETIVAYKDTYEYKIYKYNDEIDMCNEELYVCDLKVVINRIDSKYVGKIEDTIETLALVKNLRVEKSLVVENLKEFIFNEIYEEQMEKNDIEIMFIES